MVDRAPGLTGPRLAGLAALSRVWRDTGGDVNEERGGRAGTVRSVCVTEHSDRGEPSDGARKHRAVMNETRSVRLGTPSDLDRLSAVLGAAFEEDPIFEWLIRNGRGRRERLVRFFKLELEHVVLPTGAAWTTDGVAGASLELPPGAWKMPIGLQLAHGREFMRVFGAGLPRAMALITKIERRHLREPH